jgi:toxin FitB
MARQSVDRAARAERVAAAADFEPIPFDAAAAARFGTLATHVVAIGRDPRPRNLDLMIAAVAPVSGLPLYTRNAKDLRGIEAAVEIIAL